jgi:hypothetical protein
MPPTPAHAKLSYFLGKWISEATIKPSPFGPADQITIHEDAEWMDGQFFLLIRLRFTGASSGNGSGLAIMGYESDKNLYTYDEFNSLGEAIHSTGSAVGDTWTWNGSRRLGSQSMQTRLTMHIESETVYTYTFEISPDGSDWQLIMEGKDTKDG